MTVRPLSSLGPSITNMGQAAQRANVDVVKRSTTKLHGFVQASGGRYRLRGRRGNRVPLAAMSNVRAAGTSPVGMVKGIPEGFWHIVEYGRGGGYLVASRTTSGGKARRGGQATLLRNFASGESMGLKPIRTPYGPRMFARPGPHGSIGRPWRLAMDAGAPAVADTLEYEQFKAQSRAFLSTL